jgi:DNA-binding NarL/FixJ family response regulator
MPRDVLIVDDDRSALNNYGNEVRLNLMIEPFLSDDPNQAFDILRDYPIKVLVTDQVMPDMTGTELIKKIKEKLNLQIPCIMLTGYSDSVSVAEAVNLGVFRFIDKVNAHAELTQAIRQAIQRYEMDSLYNYVIDLDILLVKKKPLFIARPQVTLRLIRVTSIIDPFVREADWQTDLVAQRGVSGKHEITVKRHVASHCEYGVQAEIVERSGFEIGKAIAELKASIEGKTALSTKVKYEKELTIEAKHTLEVKEITDQLTQEGLILQSREYQSAPVFSKINCILHLECSCCQITHKFDVSINLPTNSVALRQIEHYNKGPPKTIYTGFFSGNVVENETVK